MIREVGSMDELHSILKEAGDTLVVVYFTATLCGPSLMIAPLFAKLSEKPENKNVIFLKVDVNEVADLGLMYEIKITPTFHFYKNGLQVNDFSGAFGSKLEELLADLR
ncbi:thioredoxin-like [Leuresthes tenuis]|uniref:thioredoxin-like n=1 Tax=Leuresthes tenuis TaxID=355514 RepID=UPI003B5043E9